MKKISALLVFIFFGCSFKDNKTTIKSIYIEEFKIAYFRSCLKYSFNNSKEINNLLHIDRSGYGEPILGNGYFLIDSLSKIALKKIQQDSIQSLGRVAEGSQGKKVFSNCLKGYNSKWLDSIANAEYKKFSDKK